jgi:predicted metal-dependent hydrolase
MNFSLELIEEHPPASDPRTTDIGKCLHMLLPYANEHWLDHVLAFAEVLVTEDKQLKDHLDRLLHKINFHQQEACREPSIYVSEIAETAIELEPRLKYIRQYGPIMEVFEKLVQIRHSKKLHFHDTSFAGE